MRAMRLGFVTAALVTLASAAGVQFGQPLQSCPPDAVISGTTCMDKYEASVWRVPNATTTNKILVTKIQKGTATYSDLVSHGAAQLGSRCPYCEAHPGSFECGANCPLGIPNDYPPCGVDGQNCADIFATSLPGVVPSGASWFQAQQACKNARKRLPSNAEWQAAVAGTPVAGNSGSSGCHAGEDDAIATLTGSRSACVSWDGAFDMVGNAMEWVAEWVPRSTTCGVWRDTESWGVGGNDQCFAGAATTGEPGALVRGGRSFMFTPTTAGPLAVDGASSPLEWGAGFRCDR